MASIFSTVMAASGGGRSGTLGQATSAAPVASKAPMSQRAMALLSASLGRISPRWSAVPHELPPASGGCGLPPSAAGLTTGIRCVSVGPPLSRSVPSSGSTLSRSPVVALKVHPVVSPMRL